MSKRKNIAKKHFNRINRKVEFIKPHLKLTTTDRFVGFRNLNTGDGWNFTKIRDEAGPAYVRGYQVSLGLPQMTQVCYPGQTIRINTGWNVS